MVKSFFPCMPINTNQKNIYATVAFLQKDMQSQINQKANSHSDSANKRKGCRWKDDSHGGRERKRQVRICTH